MQEGGAAGPHPGPKAGGAEGASRAAAPLAHGARGGKGGGGKAGWAGRPTGPRARRAAGPKGEEREGREKKKIFLFLISIFSRWMLSHFQSIKKMRDSAWCSKPKKITLGFTIITWLRVLRTGEVLAKRNGKEG
jgi:hypothetical protein